MKRTIVSKVSAGGRMRIPRAVLSLLDVTTEDYLVWAIDDEKPDAIMVTSGHKAFKNYDDLLKAFKSD